MYSQTLFLYKLFIADNHVVFEGSCKQQSYEDGSLPSCQQSFKSYDIHVNRYLGGYLIADAVMMFVVILSELVTVKELHVQSVVAQGL